MDRGYVRLWRKTLDSAVFLDPHLFQFWAWCLMRAAWEPRTIPVRTGRGNALIALERGQFIFGRHSAAEALRCPASTLYDRLQTLQKLEMIDTQPGTHFSIITIRNFEHYQSDTYDDRHPFRQASGTQPAPNRHKEELKHLRKDLKQSSPVVEKTDAERRRASYPVDEVVEELNRATGSKFRPTTTATRRFIESRFRDGFTLDDFQAVIHGQAAAWLSNPEMRRYLRPETLFGSKFESYLQAARPSGKAAQAKPGKDWRLERDFLDRPIYDTAGNPIDYSRQAGVAG